MSALYTLGRRRGHGRTVAIERPLPSTIRCPGSGPPGGGPGLPPGNSAGPPVTYTIGLA